MSARHRTPDHPTPLTFQILLALAETDRHGYGIIKEIQDREGPQAAPSTGALYLALQRMETDDLIEDAPPPGEEVDSRRRYYRITGKGRRVAREESARLEALVASARGKGLLSPEGAGKGNP